jgi:hypothetical protein
MRAVAEFVKLEGRATSLRDPELETLLIKSLTAAPVNSVKAVPSVDV